MEYLDRFISLSKYINDMSIEFKIENIAIIINRICNAINYIHSKGIAHRDIKPGNIMINPNTLDIRIIDSRYKLNTGKKHHTTEDINKLENNVNKIHIVGTEDYMDVKLQIRGYEYNINNLIKSDLWSLGITIFYCITCESLFDTFYNQIYYNEDQTIYGKLWNSYFKHDNYKHEEIDKKIKEIFIKNYEYGNKFNFDDADTDTIDETIKNNGINVSLHNLLNRDLNLRFL